MKSTFPTPWLAALFMSFLLVGCGGGGGGGASGTPTSVAPPPQAQLPYPIPSGLWSAPSSALPASGNYVYLQSDQGDWVGSGKTYTLSSANALIKVWNNSALTLNADLQGNDDWNGSFMLPSAAGSLQAGYFKDLVRTTSANPAAGGLDWNGAGHGCNTLTGWVVIDNVVLTGGLVTALDLRFEQHCEGGAPALHGQIHWTKANADSSQIAGPAAIPANLWRPAPGALPATGNYLYMENPATATSPMASAVYTPANAAFTVSSSGAHLGMTAVVDNIHWALDFQGMQGLTQLAVGYYAGLQRYPFHNPVLGGLSISGNGGGCNTLTGWFAVDKMIYSGSVLSSVDLRFEQFCDGSDVPLRGQLHWVVN